MSDGSARILVVEDDGLLLVGLGEVLAAAGYQPVLAEGGADALRQLETVTPDVIVSDILMPEMDGYALLAAVRKRPRLAAVPFIFLTARGDRGDVRAGMASGADDYVVKPFRNEELLDAIASRLQRRRIIEDAQSRERDDWVQTLANVLHHELRTPLAEVSAYAELLSAAEGSIQEDELAAVVRGLDHGVARLGRLIGDFLLLADLRTGRAQQEYAARCTVVSDWNRLLDGAVERHADAARRRQIRLRLDCPSRLPAAPGDPAFLVDAVGRLLDNAIKFSPVGADVWLRTRPEPGGLAIEVEDRGPGLGEADPDRLFEPLQQVDRRRLEQQGVGNGLAICRGLVDLHGGRVSAAQVPGGGSLFRIHLPAAGAPGAPVLPAADRP